jgi:hypothetical protein
MNRITRRTLIAVALSAAAVPAALAHHGWGSYDSNNVLTLNGTIRAATYENPHGTLQFDADGKTWLVILAPPSRMQNRGLEAAAMKPGTAATVVGYPSRNDPIEMRAERIMIDGKTTELR